MIFSIHSIICKRNLNVHNYYVYKSLHKKDSAQIHAESFLFYKIVHFQEFHRISLQIKKQTKMPAIFY